jgi:hypothetical protein
MEHASLEDVREELPTAPRPVTRHTPPGRRDVSRPAEPPATDDAGDVTAHRATPPRRRTGAPEHITRDVSESSDTAMARSRPVSADESRTLLPASRRSDTDRRDAAPLLAESPRPPAGVATVAARMPSPDVRPRPIVPAYVRPEANERAPAAAPSIQITIGRIEVQAVMPQATLPTTPRRSEAPALTLDAYLARRNGREP